MGRVFFFFFCPSEYHCLLIGVFRLFIFNVIIGMVGFKSILLVAFYFFHLFFIFLFLFPFGLLDYFS